MDTEETKEERLFRLFGVHPSVKSAATEGEIVDTESTLWAITEDEPYRFVAVDPEGWWRAAVKEDGCISFSRFFNRPLFAPDREPDDEAQMHICELDDLIERLTALKALADRHQWKDGWA